MKKTVLILMAFLLLSATCWAQEKAAPKGAEMTVTGMLTCTFCTMPGAAKCSKECCQSCIKGGDPATLSDAKGNLYLLLTGEQGKPVMTPERMELLESKVKVTGIMVKRGGLQAIYVKKLEKAQ